jgi:hypothetical protein
MAAELGSFVVVDLEPEPTPRPALSRWRRVLRSLQRIRRLQRIWGVLGGHLRTTWPPALRDRLRDQLQHLEILIQCIVE